MKVYNGSGRRGLMKYSMECLHHLKESSFNMTRGEGDEDIETQSLKF